MAVVAISSSGVSDILLREELALRIGTTYDIIQ
jgi:hypothetical protein